MSIEQPTIMEERTEQLHDFCMQESATYRAAYAEKNIAVISLLHNRYMDVFEKSQAAKKGIPEPPLFQATTLVIHIFYSKQYRGMIAVDLDYEEPPTRKTVLEDVRRLMDDLNLTKNDLEEAEPVMVESNRPGDPHILFELEDLL